MRVCVGLVRFTLLPLVLIVTLQSCQRRALVVASQQASTDSVKCFSGSDSVRQLLGDSARPVPCHRWLFNGSEQHDGNGVLLGAFFPIYRYNSTAKSCSEFRTADLNVELIEAFLMAVKEELVDSDRHGKTFIRGVEIRDTCFMPRFSVEQAIAMVLNSPVGKEFCDKNATIPPYTRVLSGVSSYTGMKPSTCNAATHRVPVVVGPAISRTTAAVAETLSVFQIPTITYWGTSSFFAKNLGETQYVFRTVPSDSYQTKAIAQLIEEFGWFYVIALASKDDVSGGLSLDNFRREMSERRRCIAFEGRFDFTDEEELHKLAHRLVDGSPEHGDTRFQLANVVVLFGGAEHARRLFGTMKKLSLLDDQPNITASDHFQQSLQKRSMVWLASDGWVRSLDLIGGLPGRHTALGLVFMSPPRFSRTVNEFNKRLTKHFNAIDLTERHLLENPWLALLWQKMNNCSLLIETTQQKDPKPPCNITDNNATRILNFEPRNYFAPIASGSLLLAVRAAISAIETAFSLSRARNVSQSQVTGQSLHSFLRLANISCGNGKKCSLFQSDQDVEAAYTVKLYNRGKSQNVGLWHWNTQIKKGTFTWQCSHGQTLADCIQWNTPGGQGLPTSNCSQPCKPGQQKDNGALTGDAKRNSLCCWKCVPCSANTFSSTGDGCTECETGFMPNVNRSSCIPVPPYYIRFDHSAAISVIIISAVGAALVAFTMLMFHLRQDYTMVKQAEYQPSMCLLLGLFLGLLDVVILFIEPLGVLCSIRSVLPQVFFFWTTSGILVRGFSLGCQGRASGKLKNVSRFFGGTLKRRVRTVMAITVTMTIMFSIWLAITPSRRTFYHPRPQTRHILCEENSVLTAVAFVLLLVLELSTAAVAFRVRKLSRTGAAIYEGKLMTSAAFVILLMWAALVPLFAISDRILQPVIAGLTVCAHMLGIWGCLFLPRLYSLFVDPPSRGARELTGSTSATSMSSEHVSRVSKGRYFANGSTNGVQLVSRDSSSFFDSQRNLRRGAVRSVTQRHCPELGTNVSFFLSEAEIDLRRSTVVHQETSM